MQYISRVYVVMKALCSCAEYEAGAHVVVLAGDGQNASWRFMTKTPEINEKYGNTSASFVLRVNPETRFVDNPSCTHCRCFERIEDALSARSIQRGGGDIEQSSK
jgi:hypothetical protein